jgi:uncharacterized repeat protein (TIGR03806 family)
MYRKTLVIGLIATIAVVLHACRRESVEPLPVPADPNVPSSVVFDPAEGPRPQLSAHGFFTGALKDLRPASGVLPYDIINPLFTDYASKVRHVWMPPGVRAEWNGHGRVLAFPDGAVLLKTFYYDGVLPAMGRRIVETRMMYRWQGEWFFANYVWNDQQTEATLDLSGSITAIDWVDGNGTTQHVDYRIPAWQECRTCHRTEGEAMPIGPKPRNLARSYPYADGTADQLQRWVATGYLAPGFPAPSPVPDAKDENGDLQARLRAYIDINCAHCHSAGSYCDYRPMRFAWEDTEDPVNLGLCVAPHDVIDPSQTHIVAAQRPDRSMMVYRVASTAVDVRMPLLGRTVVHEEGLALIQQWIASIPEPCP